MQSPRAFVPSCFTFRSCYVVSSAQRYLQHYFDTHSALFVYSPFNKLCKVILHTPVPYINYCARFTKHFLIVLAAWRIGRALFNAEEQGRRHTNLSHITGYPGCSTSYALKFVLYM